MNIKKFLTATLLSFLFIWMAGFAWYAFFMAEWYDSNLGEAGNVGRSTPLFIYLISALFVQAAVMSYVYPKGYESGKSVILQGLRFGLIIGLFNGVGIGFLTYATTTIMVVGAAWLDLLFVLLQFSIAGIIIALVYDKKRII